MSTYKICVETEGAETSAPVSLTAVQRELPAWITHLQASAVLERLTGVKVAPSSLAREAQRQGERDQLDAQMQTNAGCAQQQRELQMDLPLEPFTLVIELRATGTELSRWH